MSAGRGDGPRPALPRRAPGTSLPPIAYRAVGVGRVGVAGRDWSADEVTLGRLLAGLRGGPPAGPPASRPGAEPADPAILGSGPAHA